MAEDTKIEGRDVFEASDLDSVRAGLEELTTKYAAHNHDGRNSLLVNILSNAKKIRLATLNRISDKSDGSLTITGTTTLTADKFYDQLIIENGGILQPNGFRVFADMVHIKNGGIIRHNGTAGAVGGNGVSNGSPGVGGTGGAGGAAAASGSLVGGEDGKRGGVGGTSGGAGSGGGEDGAAGIIGGDAFKSLGAIGSGGGGGGSAPGAAGGSGGGGGSQVGTVYNIPRSFVSAFQLQDNKYLRSLPSIAGASVNNHVMTVTFSSAHNLWNGDLVEFTGFDNITAANNVFVVQRTGATTIDVIVAFSSGGLQAETIDDETATEHTRVIPLTGSAGSGSGGGGGGGTEALGGNGGGGGGGGGSGSAGGLIAIFSKQIINEGTITAIGGAGGNGGNGGNSSDGTNAAGGGGGGGGGGGAGGVVILVYGDLSGAGTINVAGGAAGTGGIRGTPIALVNNGGNGGAGIAGTTFSILISSL